MICDEESNFCTLSLTSSRCFSPARLPILTFSFSGLPIVVCASDFVNDFQTSSILLWGTKILLMPVQRCPAFNVISFLTSLMKISHSASPGETRSPSTMQLRESASMLKGTDSPRTFGCDFNNKPVDADPVKVTTSWEPTWSSRSPALPQINCNAPSGRIPEAMIFFTTSSVR